MVPCCSIKLKSLFATRMATNAIITILRLFSCLHRPRVLSMIKVVWWRARSLCSAQGIWLSSCIGRYYGILVFDNIETWSLIFMTIYFYHPFLLFNDNICTHKENFFCYCCLPTGSFCEEKKYPIKAQDPSACGCQSLDKPITPSAL